MRWDGKCIRIDWCYNIAVWTSWNSRDIPVTRSGEILKGIAYSAEAFKHGNLATLEGEIHPGES